MDWERIPGFAGLGDAAIVLGAVDGSLAEAHDDGRWRYPASMIKVPLAAALAADFAGGRIDPADRKPVDPANLTPNDAPSPLVAGYSARLDELADLMITRSDNVATNELFDVVDRTRVATLLAPLGLTDTHARRKLSGADPLIDDPAATGRNSFPAVDAARLFTAIARGETPGAAWLAELLSRQIWNTKLSLGLYPGDRFAHKTGDTSDVSHDGGILTTVSQTTYVVVVYTSLRSNDEADAAHATFMRGLRPFLR